MCTENIYECHCHLGCGDCKYFQCNADYRDDTTCKRLDHKHLKFAVPWFKSYDCGQQSAITCADFEPKESCKWLYEHWTSMDDYIKAYEDIEGRPYLKGKTIGLCVDGDTSVRYLVNREDFHNNTFRNEDGSLKWVEKQYYKQSRKSPIGYELIREHPSA